MKPAVVIAAFALSLGSGPAMAELGENRADTERIIVIQNQDGDVLATIPLRGHRFAVSYRNSIYGTVAEERYVVRADSRYRLDEIAADQLAVIEEYYAVPGKPQRAGKEDRRKWIAPPDPTRPAIFEALSIAATDLGERTLHVPGEPPLELWRLVNKSSPFVVLLIEENS